ncbi:phosphoribosylformylglycinamidine cyclo-ligase [Staphylospora marina]|uniref:phosphoribosylformylglycinamidine cyclo-ligase n=1 Tax=Staphylospora marina TaxID=2490858 RepID=UPI000F5BC307|nr:phosphoribosylformylglycinamidine cyclo-ligase [Staphylospora marina]
MSDAYKAAGVDIDAGNETVERIRKHVRRTLRPEVMGGIGGFGGLFRLGARKDPVLVSSTDGVGTKLKVAFLLDKHDTIGIDCVAMCVNDVVVQGAEPLFFLDYLAVGKLSPRQAEEIVKGVAEGCVQAGCALIGGETAEMPGMYAPGEYDVAGFCVGVAESDRLITGETIRPGDVLVGLASSGLHSNGYSLARKVLLHDAGLPLDAKVPGTDQTLGEALLTPTKIYVKSLLHLMNGFDVRGAAHITGGGLPENLPRILPDGCAAVIDKNAWEVPSIFRWIAETGGISEADMFRTFNMGIGMVLVVPGEEADQVRREAERLGERAVILGEVVSGDKALSFRGGAAR